eukprot:2786893-Prymnesium_polylepis.2
MAGSASARRGRQWASISPSTLANAWWCVPSAGHAVGSMGGVINPRERKSCRRVAGGIRPSAARPRGPPATAEGIRRGTRRPACATCLASSASARRPTGPYPARGSTIASARACTRSTQTCRTDPCAIKCPSSARPQTSSGRGASRARGVADRPQTVAARRSPRAGRRARLRRPAPPVEILAECHLLVGVVGKCKADVRPRRTAGVCRPLKPSASALSESKTSIAVTACGGLRRLAKSRSFAVSERCCGASDGGTPILGSSALRGGEPPGAVRAATSAWTGHAV